ncbi:MAG: DinB family protein [Alphaproteobacteria bacterium]
MKAHFEALAAYNGWANKRLYIMAANLPEDEYRRNVGAYFGSLHATLNHVLVTDRIWMRRLTGEGDHPRELNAIMYNRFGDLLAARRDEDDRIIDFVAGCGPELFEQDVAYSTLGGSQHRQKLSDILAHLFNHQTHHRGQAHTILSIVMDDLPQALDLLYFQRELKG